MERVSDTETKPSVCWRNRPRLTESPLQYNRCQHIFSNFLQVLHQLDQPWAWLAEVYLVHQVDPAQDMDLLVDLLVMLLTDLEAMVDLLPQLLLVIQVFRHPHLACPLAHQAALQPISSLLHPDSTAHPRALAAHHLALEHLLATHRHRGR